MSQGLLGYKNRFTGQLAIEPTSIIGQHTFPFSIVISVEGPQQYIPILWNLFNYSSHFSMIFNAGHRIQLQENNHQIWLLHFYKIITGLFSLRKTKFLAHSINLNKCLLKLGLLGVDFKFLLSLNLIFINFLWKRKFIL